MSLDFITVSAFNFVFNDNKYLIAQLKYSVISLYIFTSVSLVSLCALSAYWIIKTTVLYLRIDKVLFRIRVYFLFYFYFVHPLRVKFLNNTSWVNV